MAMDPAAAGDTAPAGALPASVEKLNLAYHAVIGVAIGVVSLFTGFAWPFAILTGMVIGKSNSDRRLGRARGSSAVQLLAVTGGVLGMLFFGAVIGGLIAFIVVALAAFSERVAENTKPIDQTMARILISLIGAIVWFAVSSLIGLNVNLSFGG
jgi:phosphate/sulfate permease